MTEPPLGVVLVSWVLGMIMSVVAFRWGKTRKQIQAEMAKQEILPSVIAYQKHLAEAVSVKKSIGECLESNYQKISCKTEAKIIAKLAGLADDIYESTDELAELIEGLKSISDYEKAAFYCKEKIVPAMAKLRKAADDAEVLLAKDFLPYPTYSDLLFNV